MERPACATCPFWEAWEVPADRGWCRRLPPAPVRESGAAAAVAWPATAARDWCGEHPTLAPARPEPDAPPAETRWTTDVVYRRDGDELVPTDDRAVIAPGGRYVMRVFAAAVGGRRARELAALAADLLGRAGATAGRAEDGDIPVSPATPES